MTEALKFTVLDAFTSRPFGGNPAGVVILPSTKAYPDATLQSIALELNVSATAFVSIPPLLPSVGQGIQQPEFGLRWFTPSRELEICGHATLASALILFADRMLVSADADEIFFSTKSRTMNVHRMADGKVELKFPIGELVETIENLNVQVKNVIGEALGPSNGLADSIKSIRVCNEPPYQRYMLVDMQPGLDLASLDVNARMLANQITNHPLVVISTHVKNSSSFKIRVFANGIEDPVTGAACSFAAKYWAAEAGIPSGQEFLVHQVSSRGGEVGVVWEEETGMAKLRGEARVGYRGEIYL